MVSTPSEDQELRCRALVNEKALIQSQGAVPVPGPHAGVRTAALGCGFSVQHRRTIQTRFTTLLASTIPWTSARQRTIVGEPCSFVLPNSDLRWPSAILAASMPPETKVSRRTRRLDASGIVLPLHRATPMPNTITALCCSTARAAQQTKGPVRI